MKRYIKSNTSSHKTLCIQDGNSVDRYSFRYTTDIGDLYEPDNHDVWWESYIVTPDGELLTWTLNGNYIPSAIGFWFE
jgi:hypothetical protein